MKSLTSFLVAGWFALSVASGGFAAETVALSAADPRFLYEGRFDKTNPEAPVIIWQASRVRLEFEGPSVAVRFADVKDQAFFDLEIDGRTTLVELRAGATPRGTEITGLGPGRHALVLVKLNEAASGWARFNGVALAPGGRAFAPAPPKYRVAFLFIGDSITAGACNEDGADDQWDDRRTHNNARSYGAFTAGAFSADYRNIAVSGMGVSTGWVTPRAGEIWDRVYPEPNSAPADLTTWTPDVVFVNLGENDDSFTKAKNLSFPADYAELYVALVQAIRRAYPRAEIVVLRGGMAGGAQSERLRTPWLATVTQLEAADPHVHHYVFKHWSSLHPRVADHRKMADELTAWLEEKRVFGRLR